MVSSFFGRARCSRKARLYGVNVLKALQGVSPAVRLGAEAAHRFLRLIGVDFDPRATAVETVERQPNVIREAHRFAEIDALPRAEEPLPPERRTSALSSRQHNLQETRTVPWAEPWSASSDEFPTDGGQTRHARRHAQGERSNLPEAPKLSPRSQWAAHGDVCPRYHHEDANNAGKGETGANNVRCGGQVR